MEVNLTAYFSADSTLIQTAAAESVVARAFAAAANATRAAQHPVTASDRVALSFYIASGRIAWDRKLKDVLLRCVDRSLSRVWPPLDVLQYLSSDSPAFVSGEGAHSAVKGALCVVFHVSPSAALLLPAALKQHTVEGDEVRGVQLPEPEDAAALLAAGSDSKRDSLVDMDLWYRARAAHQQYDSTVPLNSLHRLAGTFPSLADDDGGALSGALQQAQQAQRQEEKLGLLQWQLARWLTELFLNEGGWARSYAASSSSSRGSGGLLAGQSRGSADVAQRRLFESPLRPAFPHVIDAALFAYTAPPPSSPTVPDAAPQREKTVARRQLHTDVRGMEWDGLLLGYTSRYAYIAVPYYVSSAETTATRASFATETTCVWTIASRVPIPAFVHAEASPPSRTTEGHAGEEKSNGNHSADKASRKRTRRDTNREGDDLPHIAQSPESAALAQAVLARCFNVEEAMRHDKNAAETFQLTAVPFLVTVRAHRVYCGRADPSKQPQFPPTTRTTSLCAKKPHPAASPYKLALMMEDAYAVAHRRLDEDKHNEEAAAAVDATTSTPSPPQHWAAALFGVEAPTSASAAAVAVSTFLHSFPDVVSVVRESCHRFVRSHERFCSMYTRSLEASRPTQPPAALEVGGDEAVERVEVTAVAAEETAVAAVADKRAAAAPPPQSDLPPQAVAVQQLRLLRRAESVYASIADATSVHFKKLRGAARVAVPLVRTTADIAGLEEGVNVELKARVGLTPIGEEAAVRGRSRYAATMDTERLRNTIAAMAACRGGVIVVGVSDDGVILGHPTQLAVAKHLRTSGFCPAMVKDAVQVKELRWREAAAAAPGVASATVPAKKAMPENWWKSSSGSALTATEGKGTATTHKGQQGGGTIATEQQVLTVVSVEKGQAPFYATAKNTPPYQRGCASTVVMPTLVVARRLLKVLE